jgi:hypothetical protein
MLRADIEVDCPRCRYPVWVLVAEVVVETTVRCPCCRVRIQLRDDRASFATAGDIVEQHIEDMLRELL